MESKLSQHNEYYDIVIAGFGPVGQFCSNVLDQYGIKVGVIESSDNIFPEPRAISIDDETQRLINSLGLWRDFKDSIIVPDYADLIFPNGKVALRGPVAVTSNGFPFVSTFFQPELESLLRKNLDSSQNVNIFLGYELINLKEEDNIIEISVKNLKKNKLSKIKAKYLLACDGSKSFIRNKLNINTVDLKYSKEWLIADLILQNLNNAEKVARYICDPARPIIFTDLPGNRVRLEFQLLAGERRDEILEEKNVLSLISPILKDDQYRLERKTVHNYRGIYSNKLRNNNVFLLGDAAHQIPPFAGQGLNSGIKDVYNLCWKLAYVIKYGCNDKILDSYQIERIDQIQNTINSSIALGRLIDSLSIAFKKNTPLAEAIPPEAREQAYGGGRSFADRSIHKGLFFTLVKDSNIGMPMPMTNLIRDGKKISIDTLLDFRFAIISSSDPLDLLNGETIRLLKKINSIFINLSQYTIDNYKFQDLVDLGSFIVRPDKNIYGTTSENITLQDLSDDLIKSLRIKNHS